MSNIQTFRKTRLEVNLFTLAKNFAELSSELMRDTFFCPMVKANAYGHGDIQIARALTQLGCRSLGVALVEEGVRLRERQIEGDIYVFSNFDGESAKAVVEFDLTPVVGSFDCLENLSSVLQAHQEVGYPIHIEFNTSMNRLGFAPDQASEILDYLQAHAEFSLTGICTHFSDGEDVGVSNGRSALALEKFYEAEKVLSPFKPITHVMNSAALLNLANKIRAEEALVLPFRWPVGARPGIALYGYDLAERGVGAIPVEPIATLRSEVIQYHDLRAGERVSYGGTWTAPQASVIGVVPIGYADGYPRQLSNRASVLFRGQRVPVIGQVCMDYLMIDVTTLARDELKLGEDVVLWGEQNGAWITLTELASQLDTVPYTLLTGVGARVTRKYIQD